MALNENFSDMVTLNTSYDKLCLFATVSEMNLSPIKNAIISKDFAFNEEIANMPEHRLPVQLRYKV